MDSLTDREQRTAGGSGGTLSSPSVTLFCFEGRQEVVCSHFGSKQSSSKWHSAGKPRLRAASPLVFALIEFWDAQTRAGAYYLVLAGNTWGWSVSLIVIVLFQDMKLESIYVNKYQNLSAKGLDWMTGWATRWAFFLFLFFQIGVKLLKFSATSCRQGLFFLKPTWAPYGLGIKEGFSISFCLFVFCLLAHLLQGLWLIRYNQCFSHLHPPRPRYQGLLQCVLPDSRISSGSGKVLLHFHCIIYCILSIRH